MFVSRTIPINTIPMFSVFCFFFLWNLEENVLIMGTSFVESHIAMAKNSPTSSNKTIHFGGELCNPEMGR